jgi:membrane protein YdbS with pleckstrin-like domain
MTELRRVLQTANADERGHAAPLALTLVGAAGAILLAVGVAADSDVAAIIGGIVLAVGLLATTVVTHMAIDYSLFRRLDNLEK